MLCKMFMYIHNNSWNKTQSLCTDFEGRLICKIRMQANLMWGHAGFFLCTNAEAEVGKFCWCVNNGDLYASIAGSQQPLVFEELFIISLTHATSFSELSKTSELIRTFFFFLKVDDMPYLHIYPKDIWIFWSQVWKGLLYLHNNNPTNTTEQLSALLFLNKDICKLFFTKLLLEETFWL